MNYYTVDRIPLLSALAGLILDGAPGDYGRAIASVAGHVSRLGSESRYQVDAAHLRRYLEELARLHPSADYHAGLEAVRRLAGLPVPVPPPAALPARAYTQDSLCLTGTEWAALDAGRADILLRDKVAAWEAAR